MPRLASTRPGAFCWLDLAASDDTRAKAFYAQAFGWTFEDQYASGGHFTRCRCGGHDVGSLYRMKRTQLEHGVPSHWTPYIRVVSVEAVVRRITALGGRVVVAPFDVPGTARIALIEDAVGALVGLWEPVQARWQSRTAEHAHRPCGKCAAECAVIPAGGSMVPCDERNDVPVRTL